MIKHRFGKLTSEAAGELLAKIRHYKEEEKINGLTIFKEGGQVRASLTVKINTGNKKYDARVLAYIQGLEGQARVGHSCNDDRDRRNATSREDYWRGDKHQGLIGKVPWSRQ